MARFEDTGLHELLVRNLRLMGYRRPWPVQAAALEPALAGRDVLGLAETGSGKTAAFIAPIAHRLLINRPPPRQPGARLRGLVLCPTRELARQVADEAGRIAQGTVLRVLCAYGKVALGPQARAIERGVDVLIATPGRVRELIDAGALSLAHVRHIAVDEADRMLDLGFLPQVSALLEAVPQPRQTLLFTATMPGEIEQLARRFLSDPVHIEAFDATRHMQPAAHVRQHLVPVAEADKVPLLLHLLQHGYGKGALIFCRTRRRVGWVGTALQRHGIACGMIHGDRSQTQRERTLARFAEGDLLVSVATDIAARGLHIERVRTVVNYDLPLAPEEYVHRVGRAGHGRALAGGAAPAAAATAEAFTLLSPADEPRWKAIARALDLDLPAERIEGFQPPPRPRTRRGKATRETAPPTSRRPGSRQPRSGGKRPQGPGRSRPARPIKPGQHPGGGVRRLDEPGR